MERREKGIHDSMSHVNHTLLSMGFAQNASL